MLQFGNFHKVKTALACILVAACFILVGCTFEERNDNDDYGGKVKLLKTYIFNGFCPEFEYDAHNRITNIITPMGSTNGYTVTLFDNAFNALLTYNKAGDLIEVVLEDNFHDIYRKATYTKQGNKIFVLVQEYLSNPTRTNTSNGTIELNAEGMPVKMENDEGNWVTVEYQNGNISKTVKGWRSTIEKTNIYTYDDKKSPMSGCKTPKWVLALLFSEQAYTEEECPYSLKNNPTKILVNGTNSYEFVYTYDEDNYPTSYTLSYYWGGELFTRTAYYTYVVK